jgi:RNA-directed DNA polymerase
MNKQNNLFEEVSSFKNLHLAYLKARKCKRYRDEILRFSWKLEENLLKIREDLVNNNYIHGVYREFIVNDSKKREIKAAPFRDRVVHHAICNIIEPIFDKGFIYDSYACRKQKGTHRAIKKLEKFIRGMYTRERE